MERIIMSKQVKERKRQQRATKEIDARLAYKINRMRKFEGDQAFAQRQFMLQRQLTVNLGGLYRER